jgi:hypothetical protein
LTYNSNSQLLHFGDSVGNLTTTDLDGNVKYQLKNLPIIPGCLKYSASQNMLFGVFASRASPDRPSNVTFFAIDYTTGSTKVLLFLNMVYPANFIQSCVVDDATRRFTFLAYNTRDHPGFKQYLATIDYDALLLIGQWQLLPSVFQGEVVDLKIVNSQLTCLVAQTVDKWYAYFGKFNITKNVGSTSPVPTAGPWIASVTGFAYDPSINLSYVTRFYCSISNECNWYLDTRDQLGFLGGTRKFLPSFSNVGNLYSLVFVPSKL